jgi:hypothetical protein
MTTDILDTIPSLTRLKPAPAPDPVPVPDPTPVPVPKRNYVRKKSKEDSMRRSEIRSLKSIHESTPRIISRVINIALNSEDENTALKAAALLIERGWGKAPKLIDIRTTMTHLDSGPVLKDIVNMPPKEAYLQLAKSTGKAVGEEIYN